MANLTNKYHGLAAVGVRSCYDGNRIGSISMAPHNFIPDWNHHVVHCKLHLSGGKKYSGKTSWCRPTVIGTKIYTTIKLGVNACLSPITDWEVLANICGRELLPPGSIRSLNPQTTKVVYGFWFPKIPYPLNHDFSQMMSLCKFYPKNSYCIQWRSC